MIGVSCAATAPIAAAARGTHHMLATGALVGAAIPDAAKPTLSNWFATADPTKAMPPSFDQIVIDQPERLTPVCTSDAPTTNSWRPNRLLQCDQRADGTTRYGEIARHVHMSLYEAPRGDEGQLVLPF